MKISSGKALMALATSALLLSPTVASAETVMLAPNDFVGISFWTISIAVAASIFSLWRPGDFLEMADINGGGVASNDYCCSSLFLYERRVGDRRRNPTVYRYVDWLITVPLQMVEFYFILAAVAAVSAGIFWRLLIGSLVMLVGGYLGEAGMINIWLGFVIGMAGWAYIL